MNEVKVGKVKRYQFISIVLALILVSAGTAEFYKDEIVNPPPNHFVEPVSPYSWGLNYEDAAGAILSTVSSPVAVIGGLKITAVDPSLTSVGTTYYWQSNGVFAIEPISEWDVGMTYRWGSNSNSYLSPYNKVRSKKG